MLIVPHSASTFIDIDAANPSSIGIVLTAALSEAEALTSHLSGSIAPGQETFYFSFPSLRGFTSFPCNEIIGVVSLSCPLTQENRLPRRLLTKSKERKSF